MVLEQSELKKNGARAKQTISKNLPTPALNTVSDKIFFLYVTLAKKRGKKIRVFLFEIHDLWNSSFGDYAL